MSVGLNVAVLVSEKLHNVVWLLNERDVGLYPNAVTSRTAEFHRQHTADRFPAMRPRVPRSGPRVPVPAKVLSLRITVPMPKDLNSKIVALAPATTKEEPSTVVTALAMVLRNLRAVALRPVAKTSLSRTRMVLLITAP